MVDSTDIYNSLNINIGTVMENPEMLKFTHDHLKTKKIRKHTVRKLHSVLRYVLDQYKTQQMRNNAILEK